MARDDGIWYILLGVALSFLVIGALVILLQWFAPASLLGDIAETGLPLDVFMEALVDPWTLIPLIGFGLISGLIFRMYRTDTGFQRKGNLVMSIAALWIIAAFIIAMNIISKAGM